MKNELSAQTFAAIDTRVAVLSFGHYSLPVRFRFRGPVVDCQVPVWLGASDLLKTRSEVTLVAAQDTGAGLLWVFLRGPAFMAADQHLDGFADPQNDEARLNDLYELIRIEPKRLEFFDERRGWGFRETVDL